LEDREENWRIVLKSVLGKYLRGSVVNLANSESFQVASFGINCLEQSGSYYQRV
jgi:hypothetical protein